MTANERVRVIRQQKKLTMEQFGARLGVSKTAISLVERGKTSLSGQLCRSICREFEVNETWLLTGDGDIFSPAPTDEMDALAKKYGFGPMERTLLEKFLDLSEEQRQVLTQYLRNVAAAIAAEAFWSEQPGGNAISFPALQKKVSFSDVVEIDVFEEAPAAGIGNYVSDEPLKTRMRFMPEEIPSRADFGVIIAGNSMEPKYPDHCIVFVQSTKVVEPGEVGIFYLNGLMYIKQLQRDLETGQPLLHSLNPDYPDIEVPPDSEFDVQGRVLGWCPPWDFPARKDTGCPSTVTPL